MTDASPPPRLPVTLVSGFLGAGKTTLINAVLREPGFARSMVIVNEFGSVGLDHLLVGQADDQVLLLESGCLCCAATAGLRDTLIDLLARRGSGRIPMFDRIVVETSGLANPAPLIATLLGDSAIAPRCELQQVLVLVDSRHGADTLARHADARRQLALADRLLLTHGEATPSLLALLHQLNPDAAIETRRQGEPALPHFTPQALAAPRRTAWPTGSLRPQYADDEPGHAGRPATLFTRTWHVPGDIDWPHYAEWTAALRQRFGARLLRCKGLLSVAGQSWIVQGVQGHFSAPERLATGRRAAGAGFITCIAEEIEPQGLAEAMRLLTEEGIACR